MCSSRGPIGSAMSSQSHKKQSQTKASNPNQSPPHDPPILESPKGSGSRDVALSGQAGTLLAILVSPEKCVLFKENPNALSSGPVLVLSVE